ncbi:SDR family oxidoreductase [Nocardioidaceae bacterium SCSIO 66511]|nr:SDR family oxidoreductase [Nocardioidaceae bacterium SCSIO 66511]
MTNPQHTALVTGASQGLGYELASALVARGWHVIVDARTPARLNEAAAQLGSRTTAIAGDVNEPAHRRRLVDAVRDAGRLDLLVNNASTIGASPMPALADIDVATLRQVYDTNVIAPLSLIRATLPYLTETQGIVVNISSDAAVEPYEGWGGYGPSKAALDHATAILARERPEIRAYAFDPGDMRTALHQAAFPDDDISDRPEPATVVPAVLHLVDDRPPSGRVTAADLADRVGAA